VQWEHIRHARMKKKKKIFRLQVKPLVLRRIGLMSYDSPSRLDHLSLD